MLRDCLTESMKDAMRAKETRKLSTLRLILAAIKDRDIAARTEDKSEADDDAVIQGILVKMVKQRRDSIVAYDEGGRAELAEQEREEIGIIEKFLPEQMSDDEIVTACKEAVSEVEASGLKDIGRCMGALKAKYAGQMDFSKASAKVKEILS
ncbi:MAG: GatB/YqeY domain-containing protein [Proteobacteria bacterium]|nr:GatB/YqeY domain-containing protein [Pseudomonadota bacterium]